ncbi:MAG: hypothetical protein J6031_05750, partial [Bacteroidales bacterium]|nr:hypothetical protein [Bacteroidales bacterium]
MSNTFNQNNANNSYVIVKNGKHIAGTFFEMALDNFYRTIKHALRCAAVKKANFNDDKMGEALKDLASSGLTATQLSQLSRLLFRHFPFLKPLMADAADYALYPKRKEIDDMEKQVKKLIETKKEREKNDNNADVSELNGEISDLQNQIKAANSALKKELAGVSATKQLEYLSLMAMAMTFYRNTYSHKNHYNNQDDEDTQRIRESKLAKWLEIILKGERAILLERKTHSQKDTEFLTKDGDKNYNINIDKKSKRNNDFYFGPAKTTEGLKGKETEITDFGIFFFCQLFLRRTDAEQFAKETNLYEGSPFLLLPEETKKLQDLENKRAAEEQKLARRSGATHIVNPRTIGDNESVQNNIIREMMNMHRIRIPREKRIDADLSEGILAMDIMNELRRCPKELYDTFSP